LSATANPPAQASTQTETPLPRQSPSKNASMNPSVVPVSSPMPTGKVTATPVPALFEVELDTAFELPFGSIAQLKNTDLALSWISAAQDSRCPSDVTCVWAGEVAVTVMLKKGQNSESVSLKLPSKNTQVLSAAMGGYTLTLNDVKPYPRAKNPPNEPQSLSLRLTQP